MLFYGCAKTGDAAGQKPADVKPVSNAENMEKPGGSSANSKAEFVVYYFHTNVRCASCQKIETYTGDTLKSDFSGDIGKGKIEWKVVNTDEPDNKHFVKDYQLYTKSVVIVEMKDGKPGRWKNLDKVWEYLGNKEQFSIYISNEIKQFMDGV
jgi:hypothetical protein